MKRKILSGLLALCLLLSAMASGAPPMQANETTNTEAVHNHETGWTELSIGKLTTKTLSNNNYYLKKDLVLTQNLKITVTGNATLCLNGHQMDAKGHQLQFNVQKGATLTICDCSNATRQGYIADDGLWHEGESQKETDVAYPLNGGVITGSQSGLPLIMSYGSLHFESGTIAGNNTTNGNSSVIVARSGGTVQMTGGNIIGNFAQAVTVDPNCNGLMTAGTIAYNNSQFPGAGVRLNGENATFDLSGGSIYHNTSSAEAGGIFVSNKAKLNFSGEPIIKNNVGKGGKNNIFGYSDLIYLTASLSHKEPIGVSVANPDQTVLTSGWNTYMQNREPSVYFCSENEGYIILKNESGEAAFAARPVYPIQYKDVGNGEFSGTLPEGASKEHVYGIATELPVPTKSGYIFQGWYLDQTGNSEPITEIAAETNEAVTVYAKWLKALQAPTINSQPQDIVLDYGTEGALSVEVTVEADDELSYQWYQTSDKSDTQNGTAIEGATAKTLAVGKGAQPGNYYYYCVVTATREQESKHTTSLVATVTVNKPALQAPTINAQPQDIVLDYGTKGTLSVEATSPTGDPLSYQWYQTRDKDDTQSGTVIEGATAKTLAVGKGAQPGNYYYYCVVTATRDSEGQSTTSTVATVTVEAASTPPSRPTPPSETVTNPDGSITTTVTKQDGTTVATTTYPDGDKLILTTASNGVVKADLQGTKPRLVTLPADDIDPQTVAMVTDANGIRRLEIYAIMTRQGMVLQVHDGDVIELVKKEISFVDVTDSHWAKNSVGFTTARGLLVGVDESRFAPEAATSRAMVWSILARVDGAALEVSDPWYESGREWAMANGVSDGTHPNGSITREQLAAMLYRFADTPSVDGELKKFEDADSVSDWALEGVIWAVQEGLLTGTDEDTLAPQVTCSRAQSAAIFERFIAWQLGV